MDFGGIFAALARQGYGCSAVIEGRSCPEHREDGAREGAPVIAAHIVGVTERAFDDFAGAGTDEARNRRMLNLARLHEGEKRDGAGRPTPSR